MLNPSPLLWFSLSLSLALSISCTHTHKHTHTPASTQNAKAHTAHPDAAKRCRARREELERPFALLPESQGQNLALTVLCVPNSVQMRSVAFSGCSDEGEGGVEARAGARQAHREALLFFFFFFIMTLEPRVG